MLASIIAYIAGMNVSAALFGMSNGMLRTVGYGAVFGCVYGAITGIVLIMLLRRPILERHEN